MDRREHVLQRIKEVPEGFVRAYGDVSPGAPRFAGTVLAGCDDPDVPWHRIVRADGSLAQGRASAEASGGGGSPIQGSAGGHARGTHGVVRRFWWVAALAAAAAFFFGASQGSAQVSTARVATFPMAGSQAIRPEAQVSFRGAPADQLGAISVTGERSGAHTGALRAHSDGAGASFVPDKPFVVGEKVIVRTQLDLLGGRDGAISFTVARRPSPSADIDGTLKLPPLPPAAIDRFRSRRDLEAPVVRITRRAGRTAPGYIFLAPFSPKGSPRPDGPLITDNRGDLVWFKPVRRGTAVTDLKVQQLGGRDVITWWEGRFAVGWGYGSYKVFDSSYRQVASIAPKNGYRADLHDMQLTGRGTALVLAYDRVKRDLRRLGGVKHGFVLDNVVQEIDLATGLVLFEWHSLGPVPLEESRTPARGPALVGLLPRQRRRARHRRQPDRLRAQHLHAVQAGPRRRVDHLAPRRRQERLQDGQGHALLLPARRAALAARAS